MNLIKYGRIYQLPIESYMLQWKQKKSISINQQIVSF